MLIVNFRKQPRKTYPLLPPLPPAPPPFPRRSRGYKLHQTLLTSAPPPPPPPPPPPSTACDPEAPVPGKYQEESKKIDPPNPPAPGEPFAPDCPAVPGLPTSPTLPPSPPTAEPIWASQVASVPSSEAVFLHPPLPPGAPKQ